MTRWTTWMAGLASAGVLAACASGPAAGDGSRAAAAGEAAQQLTAYHWLLQRIEGAEPEQALLARVKPAGEPPVRLSFSADGRLAVQALCNNIGAPYQIDGWAIHIGLGMSTRRACAEPGLMELEDRLAQRLPQAQGWQIGSAQGEPTLQLRFADGSQWQLQGTPTDETRFGGTPERIFLEVAPQPEACQHPLIPDGRCLKVRQIEYDANGIQTGAGSWQLWYEPIEGYVHEPGVATVLRVNRYTRQNVPADASRYAYVLDMRVRSEIAR
ncbi:DUF4377 domain-containing protein [Corticibacter populi]|uniref:DUF4377 domain-containing protein n=1 Tax=Corticibacter populi TaxID=1550736 RepID=A0A3M6QNY3_9BURK|nr:META and DUF4377 domain-containing protein [Corticibacter populi]RMX04756.1 DUF4377 domain-containing protein [Corticibacter populi]RZS33839.1 heat shock protein HslJ [Corticibacter populi]